MTIRWNSFPVGAGGCASVVIFCLLLSFSHAAQAQRLSDNVIPSHYSLELTPDLKAATFAGEETIDVNIKEPTSAIILNAIELKLDGVRIISHGSTQNGTVSLDPGKQQATLSFPNPVPAGDAHLLIRFTGILNNELRGFYLSKTAKRNYAVTQFEATDARRAFPCFDEPAFKATFDVSLTIDAGDIGISNGELIGDTPGPGADKHTVKFATAPKMSTYLLAFLVGDFQCTNGEQDGVALRVCVTPDQVEHTGFAMEVAKFGLHYYDDYFGIHFPLKKLDYIGIPDFEAGAMENFGAITFRETDLLIDPKTAPLSAQKNVAVAITHEMAHQWFGDLVTMQWWDNVWLNEGFATWMENKSVAAMHPEWEIPQEVAGDEQVTLTTDAQPTTRPIRAQADTPDEINQMFDSIAYGKASDVLLMVENYLGEETFRKGVHAYLTAHEYGNATAEDFWNAQTAVSHKPVDKIMESLVAQPGVPLVSLGAPAGGKVAATQTRSYLSPSMTADAGEKWTLPVCFKTGANTQDCELLTPETQSLKVRAASVFFANARGKGYYRSAYAPAQYAALVAHVESGLTPAERISLTGDEWAQMRADKAPVGDYMDLVAALKGDTSADVFEDAVGNLSLVGDRVAATKTERVELAAWVRRTFAPEYAKLGPAVPGDSPNTIELRADLFSLLGYVGEDPEVVAQARKIADESLSNAATVDPTLAQVALGIAAEHGDAALFDKLQHVYETSTDPQQQERVLRMLVEFDDPALLERALEYSVSSKVRNQDAVFQFAIALQIPENRDAAWRFIKAHWDQVQATFTTDLGSTLVNYTGGFCTTEARDDVKAFFAAHPVAAADVALKHSIERIDGCIELRRLQEPNLQKWLAAQAQ